MLRLEMSSSTLKRSTEEKPHCGTKHCLHNGHTTPNPVKSISHKEHAVNCVGDEVRKGKGQSNEQYNPCFLHLGKIEMNGCFRNNALCKDFHLEVFVNVFVFQHG